METTGGAKKFLPGRARNGAIGRMTGESSMPERAHALRRAQACSPFLRSVAVARKDIVQLFLASDAAAAADAAVIDNDTNLMSGLRRQRSALALAVALGDLAGEFALEDVTQRLSDFADRALDRAVAADIAERVPDTEPRGFAVIAMGKLGSHELNYSSDVDLLLLFDPDRLPRRARDDAG